MIKAGYFRTGPLLGFILLGLLFGCSFNGLNLKSSENSSPPESLPVVYYAGFAYLGRNDLIDANYPHAFRLQEERKDNGGLEKPLFSSLRQSPPVFFQLDLSLPDLKKSDQNIVFAVAVDEEQVTVESHGNSASAIYAEVSLQLLFFDFSSMDLVANIRVAEASNGFVSGNDELQSEINKLFEGLYLGNNKTPGILKRAVQVLENFNLQSEIGGLRFQVTDIELGEKVKGSLPEQLQETQYSQFIGQSLSAELATQHQVSVLPYVRGDTFGNKMPGRFANGEVFTLTLPEPDYAFEFTLNKFVKQPVNESNTIYAAYGHFRFVEPFQNSVYVEDDFRYGVPKEHLPNQKLNDWVAYTDATEELLADFVTQLGDPDYGWVESHARNPNKTYDDFKVKQKLFDQGRK